MMEGWKKEKLANVFTFHNGKKIKPQVEGEHIAFGSNGPIGNSKKILFDSGIIIGRVGAYCGSVFLPKEPFWASDNTIVVKVKDSYDQNFMCYYLSLLNLNWYAGGSAQPLLTHGWLKPIKINLPPLPIQRKIASILSAYDDLIENNLKRIKILEEKAQLTYEEWFSVKGVPDGWKEYKLGELINFHIGGGWGVDFQTEDFPDPAYVIRGTDMDNLPLGSIENVPNRWHKVSNLKSRRLQHGDIVFEVSGGSSYEGVAKTILITEGLLKQFNGDVMCASFCKLMRPKSISYSYALILFLKYLRKTNATEIFEKQSASNIVNYNWEAFLKFQAVKMPDNELLEQFNDLIGPMISSIYNLGNQTTKLKEARDILLPRLMTGMIDVEKMNLETPQPATA